MRDLFAEVDAVVLGNEAAAAFEDLYKTDLKSAHRIERAQWSRRADQRAAQ